MWWPYYGPVLIVLPLYTSPVARSLFVGAFGVSRQETYPTQSITNHSLRHSLLAQGGPFYRMGAGSHLLC